MSMSTRHTQATCLNCSNEHAELLSPGDEERRDYRCSACGDFSVTSVTARLFEQGLANPEKIRFVVINGKGWLTAVDV
jgi:uncharacterized Zn finger protein